MRPFLQKIWLVFKAPIRFVKWIYFTIKGWLSGIRSDLIAFFEEEPEESPLGETIQKTVDSPEALFIHLNDLRKHLLRSVIFLGITITISFVFSSRILEFLSRPLEGGADSLIAIEVTEPIGTFMRISLLAGFALALPYIAFELFRFIAPGISIRSRIWGLSGIPVVVIFFLGGMAFAYFVMLPAALPFLLNILEIDTQLRPSSYISFVTSVMFWVGIAFEFPLVIFFLAAMGIVNAKMLADQWRLAIVIIAIVSALITPTIDPVNMALVMGPMIALYFLSILLASLAQRGRKN